VVVGKCTLEIKNKTEKIEINLEAGHRGVWVKPMNWVTLSDFSDDCCILVLASDSYDPSDYINSFEELETDLMIERSKSEQ
jgi:dTDP-4-dehydrorhamnose 3,5-epimerase